MADAQVTLLDCTLLIQRATTSVYPMFTATILLTQLACMHKERYTRRYIPDFTRWLSSPYIKLSGSKPETQSLILFKRSVKLSDLFEGSSLLSGVHDIQNTLATHNPCNQSIRAPISELRLSFLKLLMQHGSFLNHLASLESLGCVSNACFARFVASPR